jgi:serine/threonine-protein kinase RsbW
MVISAMTLAILASWRGCREKDTASAGGSELNGFRPKAAAEKRVELPRHASAAGEARRFVDGQLRDQGLSEETRESARLVSSELVTNALRHGKGKIELRLRLLGDFLRIEVVDQGHDQAPAVRQELPDESGGWGLRIVDQLAVQWGVFEGTTHVWADLPVA